ncbi:MAG TPA: YdeI/OmpD-associated family protein, partial [Kiritimatiellia bacterium]|nr:YdeI/OmpD-associated family protein [Kiritimatiellia bacterium]
MNQKNKAGSFRAMINEPEGMKTRSPWGFILLPKKVSDLLTRRGRATVQATINGYSFQVTLEPDGNLSHWLYVDAQTLRAAEVEIGDDVDVTIEPLPVEPTPKPPADFAKALAKNPEAKSVWDSTTAIAQVDWIHWIESGKLAKTRNERIEKACDMLESGKKRVCCFDPSGFYSKS